MIDNGAVAIGMGFANHQQTWNFRRYFDSYHLTYFLSGEDFFWFRSRYNIIIYSRRRDNLLAFCCKAFTISTIIIGFTPSNGSLLA